MDRWENPEWANQMAISLDFSGMMEEFIGGGRGISLDEIKELAPLIAATVSRIENQKDTGELAFYHLPYDVATAGNIVQLATVLRKNCENLVVLGIGGSALGSIALFRALCHPLHNLLSKQKRHEIPRVFYLDNIDPSSFRAVLDYIDLEKTIFNVVTKSGSTVETMSQFFIIRDMLKTRMGEAAARKQIIVTTDNRLNPLRKAAADDGLTVLDIPENVGGRFSVFSPVGLFPAAVLGIDIEELISGAWDMDKRCRTGDVLQNPAYLSGTLHYLADTRKGLHISVIMPYADALLPLAYWFRQLWAESLGKAKDLAGNPVFIGQTPIAALGATDQHSQLQLYLEGPFDKMITLISVKNHDNHFKIPFDTIKELGYLEGHSLGEIFDIEEKATQKALLQAGRSNMNIVLPEINPFTIGQLLFLFEVQTVFTGGLYNVNPLDQPGVQSIKDYIYGALDRPGFESQKSEFQNRPSSASKYII